MGTYASTTEVSAASSRDKIERTLARYGASSFAYYVDGSRAMIAFDMRNRRIRFAIAMPDRGDREFTHHSRGPRTKEATAKAWEQASRQRWRALDLVVKAKLEAVESGIAEFDQEFLPYFALADGQTVFERAGAQIVAQIENNTIGPLMLEQS